MLTSFNFKMMFTFAIVSNISITTLKFVNKMGAKIYGNGVLEFKQTTQSIFKLKTTFILHCGNVLLTDLYKRFLKCPENFLENGGTINNSLLDTIGTVCLGTYNLSKNFLIH